MNNLFSKIKAGIRYVENFNDTVTIRKSDFENLVQRVENSEKDSWKRNKKEIGKGPETEGSKCGECVYMDRRIDTLPCSACENNEYFQKVDTI